jgi:hypothetical protein
MVKKSDDISPILISSITKLVQCGLSNSTKVLYLTLLKKSGFRYGISFKSSRKELMSESGIGAFETYHKGIKELCDIGYIKYSPSFAVKDKSTFKIIV